MQNIDVLIKVFTNVLTEGQIYVEYRCTNIRYINTNLKGSKYKNNNRRVNRCSYRPEEELIVWNIDVLIEGQTVVVIDGNKCLQYGRQMY